MKIATTPDPRNWRSGDVDDQLAHLYRDRAVGDVDVRRVEPLADLLTRWRSRGWLIGDNVLASRGIYDPLEALVHFTVTAARWAALAASQGRDFNADRQALTEAEARLKAAAQQVSRIIETLEFLTDAIYGIDRLSILASVEAGRFGEGRPEPLFDAVDRALLRDAAAIMARVAPVLECAVSKTAVAVERRKNHQPEQWDIAFVLALGFGYRWLTDREPSTAGEFLELLAASWSTISPDVDTPSFTAALRRLVPKMKGKWRRLDGGENESGFVARLPFAPGNKLNWIFD